MVRAAVVGGGDPGGRPGTIGENAGTAGSIQLSYINLLSLSNLVNSRKYLYKELWYGREAPPSTRSCEVRQSLGSTGLAAFQCLALVGNRLPSS